jgi:putative membrane protein
MNFLVRILISTAAVLLTGWVLPDTWVKVDNVFTALIVAVVLAFLNQVVKPILIVLTIPITFLTMGLFLLAINAGVILLADYFIEGFTVGGFWSALGFSIVLAIFNSLLGGNRKGGGGIRFQRFDSRGFNNQRTEDTTAEDMDQNDNNRPRIG